MLPTPVPPIVEVAPVTVNTPVAEWLQLMVGGMTALAAFVAAIVGVIGLFHLKTIKIEFNSAWHELLKATKTLGQAEGAASERERSEKAQEQGR